MDFNELSRQLGVITQSISQLNHDYTALSLANAVLQERVDWLCRFFWIIVGAQITTLTAVIWNIILHKKNNK